VHLAAAVAPNIDRHTYKWYVHLHIYLETLYKCFLKHNVYTALCSDKTHHVVKVHIMC